MDTVALPDLDSDLRQIMLAELERDIRADSVFVSKVAVAGSKDVYFKLLRDALRHGGPASLARGFLAAALFKSHQSNGATVNQVEAAERLADGQFLAYYARAVCVRAIGREAPVTYYRAQETADHRAESDRVIGETADPVDLLKSLRDHSAEPWKVGHLGNPNSGLCIRVG